MFPIRFPMGIDPKISIRFPTYLPAERPPVAPQYIVAAAVDYFAVESFAAFQSSIKSSYGACCPKTRVATNSAGMLAIIKLVTTVAIRVTHM
jgi:hypothetical protein